MRIEEYFRQIQKIIDSYSVIQSSKIMFDKRGTYEGFSPVTLTGKIALLSRVRYGSMRCGTILE